MQVRVCERARVALVNNLLTLLWRQLLKLFGQLCAGRKDGRAVGCVVDHVHNLSIALAVLLQQRCDDLARRVGVGNLQLTLCVFVLSVDDD